MEEKYSHRFQLPNNKWVYVQTEEMVERGQAFTEELSAIWHPPKHFYHLKRGGHVRALKKHAGHQYFAAVDLSNFFGHVTKSKVIRALKTLKIEYEQADYIASSSTIRSKETGKYILPFGFTQSPLLASIVFDKSLLGAAIRKIKASGVYVSVYVDDIILSSDCSKILAEQYDFLSQAIVDAGFTMNTQKSQPVSNEIKAFNITLSNTQLAIDPARLEEFLTKLYRTGNEYVIHGVLGYVGTVNKDQASMLAEQKEKGVF